MLREARDVALMFVHPWQRAIELAVLDDGCATALINRHSDLGRPLRVSRFRCPRITR